MNTNPTINIPVRKLRTFEGHPYKVLDDDEMDELTESIREHGILSPPIVRPLDGADGEYEVISGHRRLHAAQMAGVEVVPAFVHEIDRDAAAIELVDSNLHKLTDDRFTRMSAKYEAEQKDLEQMIASCEEDLRKADEAKVDFRMLLKGLREFTELRELTPAIVNTVIRRIEVHNSDRSSGHIRVKVDIHFTAVGMISLPNEKEITAMQAEITANPKQHRVSA